MFEILSFFPYFYLFNYVHVKEDPSGDQRRVERDEKEFGPNVWLHNTKRRLEQSQKRVVVVFKFFSCS